MQFQQLFYCNKLERNLALKALFSKPDLSTRTENEMLQILEQTHPWMLYISRHISKGGNLINMSLTIYEQNTAP